MVRSFPTTSPVPLSHHAASHSSSADPQALVLRNRVAESGAMGGLVYIEDVSSADY
jgi:hypothetical protein